MLISGAAFIAMTGSALSADIVEAPIVETPVAVVSGWDGLYLGVFGAYSHGEFTNYDKNSKDCWWCENDYGSDLEGFSGGGTIGYNVVTGQFLWGIEAELGGGSIDGSAKDPYNDVPETDVDINYYGTVAGRAGVIAGDFLMYGKAGWGFVNADLNWSDEEYGARADGSATMDGAVYGGGIEYAFMPNMSVKFEYLRFHLDATETLDVKNYSGDYKQTIGIDNVDTFKIGLNFQF